MVRTATVNFSGEILVFLYLKKNLILTHEILTYLKRNFLSETTGIKEFTRLGIPGARTNHVLQILYEKAQFKFKCMLIYLFMHIY